MLPFQGLRDAAIKFPVLQSQLNKIQNNQKHLQEVMRLYEEQNDSPKTNRLITSKLITK